MYRNNIVGALKVPLCPSLIKQMLRLPGGVSPVGLHNASLQITLSVPEMVDAETEVTSSLPFLLDPKSIAKMRSWSLRRASEVKKIEDCYNKHVFDILD